MAAPACRHLAAYDEAGATVGLVTTTNVRRDGEPDWSFVLRLWVGTGLLALVMFAIAARVA